MADKTTTLKTKTNDNVYPNVIGDNRDNAISDSPQIKHTLTAEHKINFRLDTNVNNLINNSLQKPSGLTKTELVGVGTNGQENIEIGDNLTLANGKLSATGGGGGAKIYRHCISISQNTANDKLEAYLTYYTTSQTKFVMTTLKNICPDGKTYECCGYYAGGSGKGPITNLVGSTNFPFLKYGNISASSFSMNTIHLDDYRFTLNDEVNEVN